MSPSLDPHLRSISQTQQIFFDLEAVFLLFLDRFVRARDWGAPHFVDFGVLKIEEKIIIEDETRTICIIKPFSTSQYIFATNCHDTK